MTEEEGILQGWVGAFGEGGLGSGDGLWFISEHEVEWGFAGGGVRAVVVDEFGHRDVVSPSFRVRTAEDAEVGFDFLVESFHFSVCLRVVCCR